MLLSKIIAFVTNIGYTNVITPEYLLLWFKRLSFYWTAFGIFLTCLQLFVITKSRNYKTLIVLIIFMLFSGLDLFIGEKPHWSWHMPFSYLDNTYQLFYSYHIAVSVWLLTTLMMQKLHKIDYFGLLSVLYLFYCPMTIFCVGIFFPFYTIKEFMQAIKTSRLNEFWKNLIDIKNILAVCILFPIVYLFFHSNYTSSHFSFYLKEPCRLAYQCIIFGVGIYLMAIAIKFYKNSLYYMIALVLLAFPFVAYKTDYDFMMRATIPAIIILMIFVIKFLFIKDKNLKLLKYLLITALFIGSISPLSMIFTMFGFWNSGLIQNERDNIITFQGKITPDDKPTDDIFDFRNYASINYEKYVFWKYLAKKRKGN